jgi:Single-strand binding protein family
LRGIELLGFRGYSAGRPPEGPPHRRPRVPRRRQARVRHLLTPPKPEVSAGTREPPRRPPQDHPNETGGFAGGPGQGVGRAADIRGADFVDIVCFDKFAATCAEWLTKGREVAVAGKLRLSEWTSRDGERRSRLQVVADAVRLGSVGTRRGAVLRRNALPVGDRAVTMTQAYLTPARAPPAPIWPHPVLEGPATRPCGSPGPGPTTPAADRGQGVLLEACERPPELDVGLGDLRVEHTRR